MTRQDRARGSGRALVPGAHTIILSVYLAVVVLPILWVLATSFKTTRQMYADPFGLPPIAAHPGLVLATAGANYGHAWIGSHFQQYFLNSVYVVALSLGLTLFLGAPAAYALARFEFRGRRAVLGLFLAGLFIPMQLILIPLFFQYTWMGAILTHALTPVGRLLGLNVTVSLHDSHAGLVLIYVAASLPFTVFTLTGFMRTLPGELRDAALIDGASEFRTLWQVMVPLARPGITTVAIFNFLGLWNEYLFGLVFLTSDRLKTLPLGLSSISMQAQYKTDYGLLFAALVISMVPVLVVYGLLQQQITRGIAVGAVKG